MPIHLQGPGLSATVVKQDIFPTRVDHSLVDETEELSHGGIANVLAEEHITVAPFEVEE